VIPAPQGSEVCFSGPALGVVTPMVGTLGAVISVLFWQLMKAKDRQIDFYKSLSDRAGDIADLSVSSIRRDRSPGRGAE
jgi:hypothetical protein